MIKCPSCGFENIAGEDRCAQCFYSLMNADLPKPVHDDAIQSVMMTAPVAEILTGKNLLVADPEDTMDKIIKILHQVNRNCILVYDEKKLVGILSRRDILKKIVGVHKDLTKVKIGSVMTPNPEYVRAEDPIAFVVNKMALGGFRHVPVIAADGRPLSIIAIKDVLHYLSNVS